MRLDSIAVAIRSKNAGPCLITLDIIFADAAGFERGVTALPRLRTYVAERYHRSPGEVRGFVHGPSRAIKITIARERLSGSVGDSDVYGAQQHAPLLGFEL